MDLNATEIINNQVEDEGFIIWNIISWILFGFFSFLFIFFIWNKVLAFMALQRRYANRARNEMMMRDFMARNRFNVILN